jgi:lipopolysaccharide export LptBFGC system permease protein LptF
MDETKNSFSELRTLITEYLDARLTLLKLGAYEKIAKVTAALFSSLIIALLIMLLFFFLSLSAGFYLGNLFGSNGLGFLTVSGFYLLLFLLLKFRKEMLVRMIIERIIRELMQKEEEYEQGKED